MSKLNSRRSDGTARATTPSVASTCGESSTAQTSPIVSLPASGKAFKIDDPELLGKVVASRRKRASQKSIKSAAVKRARKSIETPALNWTRKDD